MSTPAKNSNTSLTTTLTPVRFLDSPKKTLDNLPADSNVAVCKTRLEVIIKTLQDNYAKWQLAQKRGLSLCNSIEVIKTRVLEAASKSTTVEEINEYPKDLKPYCDKLAIITSIFIDITKNARESLRQLRALCKLPGCAHEIFYRTWQLIEYANFTEQLLVCYEKEAEIKQYIMQNLAHCTTRAELIRCTTAWEYPQYVDESVTLHFAFLAEELKSLKR